jgi:phospholipid/cholesterol/gamma-HCH transport system permease protein
LSTLLDVHRGEGSLELQLSGEWRALRMPEIDTALAALDLAGISKVVIVTDRVAALDLSGAWRLRELLRTLASRQIQASFRGAEPDQLRLIDETLSDETPPPGRPALPEATPAADTHLEEAIRRPLIDIGRSSIRFVRHLRQGVAFLGRVSVTFARAALHPHRLRPVSIARHVYDTGITAIPIVALIAFLISVIIAYMSAQQLISFGATIFVVDLVTIGVLRELGVLLTAIIVAGRSGSAFSAEIGAMRLNEEVDALIATGVDPFEVLVLPRVLGLIIALPLLTVIADIIGLMGGALLCRFLLDMPLTQFVDRVNEAIAPTTFWVGIIKAPVFALAIALAGAYRGMQVRGSSRELGRLTTVAVVQSIFLVILADAVFAVLFLELDI